jgi:hypothetical protein
MFGGVWRFASHLTGSGQSRLGGRVKLQGKGDGHSNTFLGNHPG